MLLFRSDEHLEAWLAVGDRPEGERLKLDQQWELAKRWFVGRHLRSWKKRTAAEAEGVFRSVGLTSNFWSLSS